MICERGNRGIANFHCVHVLVVSGHYDQPYIKSVTTLTCLKQDVEKITCLQQGVRVFTYPINQSTNIKTETLFIVNILYYPLSLQLSVAG